MMFAISILETSENVVIFIVGKFLWEAELMGGKV